MLAAVVAGFLYLVLPSDPGRRKLLEAAVTFALLSALFIAVLSARRLRARVAVGIVHAGLYALRRSGSSLLSELGGDNRFDWLTDQLLVAQRRYAFSVGCLAFRTDDDGITRCLMRHRPFDGFGPDKVLLWPGGRIRGSMADFEQALTQMIRTQTGCTVHLLTTRPHGAEDFATELVSYNPATKESDLTNKLLQPPVLVMQQNRVQSHDVPGHFDLLYLARVAAGESVSNVGYWLDVSAMNEHDERELWMDTRNCVGRAAQIFASIGKDAGTAGSSSPASEEPA